MENTQDGEGHGFCQARQAGDLLFCSGQIGLDADGAVPAQPEDQFAAAFAALSRVLAQHGCTMDDVVDLTTFHVGYPANMPAFMSAMGAAMPGPQPAWTAIGVAALGYPDTLVELKAVARIPTR